jgi:hypothetical protein
MVSPQILRRFDYRARGRCHLFVAALLQRELDCAHSLGARSLGPHSPMHALPPSRKNPRGSRRAGFEHIKCVCLRIYVLKVSAMQWSD